MVDRADADGCWLWTGAINNKGYGLFALDGYRHCSANRASWILTYGDPGDLFVLHSCDNPPCVRPEHLHLGTQKDNSAEMVARGRSTRGRLRPSATGENSWKHRKPELIPRGLALGRAAKLTPDLAAAIRHSYARGGRGGTSAADLALEYGVSKSTISRVLHDRVWVP